MFYKMILPILIILKFSIMAFADIPSWAKGNLTKKSGHFVTTVCDGTGPSASLARKEAIGSCQISARQFLDGEIQIKTLTVETESSVGLHQEVEESSSVRNLICNPKKEEVVEKDGQFQVWVQCEFDLSKSEVKTKVPPVSNYETSQKQDGLKSIKPAEVLPVDVDHRTLTIETVPQCESVLVRGKKPRNIICKSNPLQIPVEESDTEIIVRAKGFQPKTIKIEKGGQLETIQVFLERN